LSTGLLHVVHTSTQYIEHHLKKNLFFFTLPFAMATLSSSVSSSVQYGRLERSESEDATTAPLSSRPPRRTVSEKMQDKLEAFLWVMVASIVTSYSWNTILSSENKVNTILLQLAILLIVMNVTLLAYLLIYLPRCKGLTDSSAWPVYCPRVVPSMIVLAIVSFLLFVRATWPVWGFLAPLILAVQALGAIYALQFVPWPVAVIETNRLT